MEDIIRLLPDAVANQIAAGEVIQRPASVVKELLENAIDANATNIQLIVKDAGKTLIQVVDNGKGMSFNDARLCFERHATSKLRSADDLFHISTKGFRGEALASVAAIAHVELKTKQPSSDMATVVNINGSEIKEHAPTTSSDGTSIAVKNIFFNVPARRNFLKSDKVELTHIEEEFYRVALIHHDVSFNFYNNDKLELQLPASNFRQRIVNVFGQHFNDKLFPVELNHELMNIQGFIAKPENSKKQKSEQYMFVNNRYVRHNLLNFAVEKAYSELIPQGYHPAYFISITINPEMIDVNVSPTKVEVKLQDERLFFGFLNSAVKKSLGTMSLTPMLDFDESYPFKIADAPKDREIVQPGLNINTDYNPFNKIPEKSNRSPFNDYIRKESQSSSRNDNWQDFLGELKIENTNQGGVEQQSLELTSNNSSNKIDEDTNFQFFINNGKYLFLNLENQVFVFDLHNLQERLLFDRYYAALSNSPIAPQQTMFPQVVTLTIAQADLAMSLKSEFLSLGYDLEKMDNTHIAVNATPNDEEEGDLQAVIESVLNSWQISKVVHKGDQISGIALGMARQKRSKQRMPATPEEVRALVNALFNSSSPTMSPSGKNIVHMIVSEEISKFFN